ncbi:MAG: exosortase/archaeosortase family protein [Rubritalea sp.]|uniref:exosortase/archaeosortase family protein n=1 Tax=Rubritalea sp. TaxID=2109375 RepID=UPI003242F482
MNTQNKEFKAWLKSPLALPLSLIALVVLYYFCICDVYTVLDNRKSQVFQWMVDSWNGRNDLLHGFAVPFLFLLFSYQSFKVMQDEPDSSGKSGIAFLLLGLLLFVGSARTIQPRLALIGIPFLISGSVIYACGWRAGRHMLFPAFFWWFAIPVPGLNQLTNFLQVFVTQACYYVGSGLGMDLINTGNDITSATGKWSEFKIAEGCSGIRSLMALVMIAAIFAYYTQDKLWKKAVLFASALPLALFGNFCRVFTILVLAECGFEAFAGGLYHDFAGFFIFFPAALGGLILLDRLLNPKKFRKKVKVTQKG